MHTLASDDSPTARKKVMQPGKRAFVVDDD
jgi:hypothetical protein